MLIFFFNHIKKKNIINAKQFFVPKI